MASTEKPLYAPLVALTLALAAGGAMWQLTPESEGLGASEKMTDVDHIADVGKMVNVTDATLALIRSHTEARYVAYADPAHSWKVPTICYGHTRGVKRGDKATLEQCEKWLLEDYEQIVKPAFRLITRPLTENQAAAIGDFIFNVGATNFSISKLLRDINAGRCNAAAAEFGRWNKAAGKVMRGLTIRRGKERALFEADCEVWE